MLRYCICIGKFDVFERFLNLFLSIKEQLSWNTIHSIIRWFKVSNHYSSSRLLFMEISKLQRAIFEIDMFILLYISPIIVIAHIHIKCESNVPSHNIQLYTLQLIKSVGFHLEMEWNSRRRLLRIALEVRRYNKSRNQMCASSNIGQLYLDIKINPSRVIRERIVIKFRLSPSQ